MLKVQLRPKPPEHNIRNHVKMVQQSLSLGKETHDHGKNVSLLVYKNNKKFSKYKWGSDSSILQKQIVSVEENRIDVS